MVDVLQLKLLKVMVSLVSCLYLFLAPADRAFEGEINCSNPLGTGGRLAIGFAVLLRALWKGTHHAFQPSKLKVCLQQDLDFLYMRCVLHHVLCLSLLSGVLVRIAESMLV